MVALSMPGLAEWFIILVFIGTVWLVISTVISIARNPTMEMNHKLIWVLIVVLAPILGAICYYVFTKNASTKS
jgi:predicted membrane channel-forming protein YqfA (hemolysin III family)